MELSGLLALSFNLFRSPMAMALVVDILHHIANDRNLKLSYIDICVALGPSQQKIRIFFSWIYIRMRYRFPIPINGIDWSCLLVWHGYDLWDYSAVVTIVFLYFINLLLFQ